MVFFGVGGSGRSPLESADPQVRRVGRPYETYRRKLWLGKLRKQYRWAGAGAASSKNGQMGQAPGSASRCSITRFRARGLCGPLPCEGNASGGHFRSFRRSLQEVPEDLPLHFASSQSIPKPTSEPTIDTQADFRTVSRAPPTLPAGNFSVPRHSRNASHAMFLWGRRQWAQPSRVSYFAVLSLGIALYA